MVAYHFKGTQLAGTGCNANEPTPYAKQRRDTTRQNKVRTHRSPPIRLTAVLAEKGHKSRRQQLRVRLRVTLGDLDTNNTKPTPKGTRNTKQRNSLASAWTVVAFAVWYLGPQALVGRPIDVAHPYHGCPPTRCDHVNAPEISSVGVPS